MKGFLSFEDILFFNVSTSSCFFKPSIVTFCTILFSLTSIIKVPLLISSETSEKKLVLYISLRIIFKSF